MSVGIGAQELYHALGRILSIGIHHDDGVAAGRLLNMCQPDGDCPLVSKIAAQTQSSYRSHNREVALEIVTVASLHRAIIDQENLHGAGIGRHGFVKPPD
jgi:hypothetical protein